MFALRCAFHHGKIAADHLIGAYPTRCLIRELWIAFNRDSLAVELDSSALRSIVAFTGRLACMTRAEAFELVRQHGGTPSQAVTRQTNVLVVGELGWPLLDDGRPSNKLSRAGSYGIPVVSERRFLEWTGKAVPDSLHRAYSADQIATLSNLSSSTVDELVRFGLLDPEAACSGFAIWRALGRFRSYLRMALGSLRSFAA
jgi:hypothetical protein